MPDAEIFDTLDFSHDHPSRPAQRTCFPSTKAYVFNSTMSGMMKTNSEPITFQYDGGLASFVTYYNQNKEVLHPEPIYMEGIQSDVAVEIAFQFNTSYSENISSYANNIRTGGRRFFMRAVSKVR